MVLKDLEQLFIQQQHQLYVLALAITRNRVAAEDAVHDALLAVANLTTPPRDLKPYLFRVVRNKALLHQRKQYDSVAESDMDDFLGSTELSGEQATLANQVVKHIRQLSAEEQQCLMLKLFNDMTFHEIAELLESSPNTVASWYRRGLGKLKEKINAER